MIKENWGFIGAKIGPQLIVSFHHHSFITPFFPNLLQLVQVLKLLKYNYFFAYAILIVFENIEIALGFACMYM